MLQAFKRPNAKLKRLTSLPSSVPNFDSFFVSLIRFVESFLQRFRQLLQRVRHIITIIPQYLLTSAAMRVDMLAVRFWSICCTKTILELFQNVSNGVVSSYFGGFKRALVG